MIRIYISCINKFNESLEIELKYRKGDNYRICKGSNGKKYFIDNSDLFFNITKTRGIWVCAFFNEEIGVDVENVEFIPENFNLIANRFFTVEETKYCKNNKTRFVKLWTLKESFVKCLGIGIGKEFSYTEFVKDNHIIYYVNDCCFTIIKCGNYYIAICSKTKIKEYQIVYL